MPPDNFSKYDGFYLVSDKDTRESVYLQPYDGDTSFPYLEVLKNGPSVNTPVPFLVKKGSRWGDLIYAGWPGLYVVSPKFRDALKELDGVRFYPTLITDKKTGQINDSYVGLSATGRSGPIIRDWYREAVVTEGFLPVRMGLFFSLDTWDGSDFFIPEDSGLLFVTERVKAVIEQQKLANVDLTKIADLENYKL